MITDAILAVLGGLVSVLFGWLPDGTTLDLSGFSAVFGAARSLNEGLPVVEMLGMVGALLVVQGGIFAFRTAYTLWQALPGKFS